MSRVFPKLAKAITLAAKDGGSDPESNAKLRVAINNSKAQNMPKDNIETAIKRASGKDLAAIAEVNYEGKGPHGVLLFIECASDNTNRLHDHHLAHTGCARRDNTTVGAFTLFREPIDHVGAHQCFRFSFRQRLTHFSRKDDAKVVLVLASGTSGLDSPKPWATSRPLATPPGSIK